MKVSDLFDIYIDLKNQSLSPTTLRSIKASYYNHIDPVIGDKDYTTLRYVDYQNLANKMLQEGLKPKTVKNAFGILSGMYLIAKKTEIYIGENWVSFVELPSFDNKQYFTISKDMQVRYIKALMNFNEPIYRDIFVFLLHGRRLNEVLSLRWEFIDISNRMMYLPASINKSKKNLSFMLTDEQLEILNRHLSIAEFQQDRALPFGYVFKNPFTGKRYSNIRKPFERMLKRANLPKIRIHDIRHLVGTHLINELDLSVEVVSQLLGHSDITITQRYINKKPQNAKFAMDKLFDSLKSYKRPNQEDLGVDLSELRKEIQ